MGSVWKINSLAFVAGFLCWYVILLFWHLSLHSQPRSISSTDKCQTQTVSCYRQGPRQSTSSCFSFFSPCILYQMSKKGGGGGADLECHCHLLLLLWVQFTPERYILGGQSYPVVLPWNGLQQSVVTSQVPGTALFFLKIVTLLALMRHPTILRETWMEEKEERKKIEIL